MEKKEIISGSIVDVHTKTINIGSITIQDGKISEIILDPNIPKVNFLNINKKSLIKEHKKAKGIFIMPGFVDAHVHIDDSLLCPYEFARVAVSHGTVAAVCDPHEIANVCGIEGINYMIENGKQSPFKFYYGAPSCVPATCFETSGATLGPAEIGALMARPDIHHLCEVMNYPGVINNDPDMLAKLAHAKANNKPIDGHCPFLTGADLRNYISHGITTDHECTTIEEARERVLEGMKVIVREGSATRNLGVLQPIIDEAPDRVMLCVDDILPFDFVNDGEIDYIVKKSIENGSNFFNVIRAATINPVEHYHLEVGLLRKGDPADFIVVDSMDKFKILKTYIGGKKVYDSSEKQILEYKRPAIINNFNAFPIKPEDLIVEAIPGRNILVIGAINADIITKKLEMSPKIDNEGNIICDLSRDILKIVVLNRYAKAPPSIGFINGFGLKSGALACSIAHDSHNIVCVGTNDDDIAHAINMLILSKGGKCGCKGSNQILFPLPIAGLMSDKPYEVVLEKSVKVEEFAQELGSTMKSPFATLCFMALAVVPELKITDKGIFDGTQFKLVSLFC